MKKVYIVGDNYKTYLVTEDLGDVIQFLDILEQSDEALSFIFSSKFIDDVEGLKKNLKYMGKLKNPIKKKHLTLVHSRD